jgi:F-box protein 9
LPIGELIASFSGLKIEPQPPPVEGMPQPPCPLADLPDEILVHILRDVAIDDVGDFARLSRVCKRLAYLVATEQRIWRRVAMGSEVGFSAMLYRFERGIEWDDLPEEEQDDIEIVDGVVISPAEIAQRRHADNLAFTESLTPSVYPTWKNLFRSRPRIRFNGCYISTVNYVRTGQISTNQTYWGSPIHIVTYYRYLRFFRDGTLISLLTTAEPSDVVHHLTREDLHLHRDVAHPHLPSAVMALALRGRWRLSSAADRDDPSVMDRPTIAAGPHDRDRDPEGDVFVETEGVGSKYMYRMDLSMRSAGKGARNNKLIWRGFYSYNKLTDDWGEFGLKNDKPFFFSRVKSYGFSE